MKCSRCGKNLEPGRPSWKLEIRISADVAGIPEEASKSIHELEDLIRNTVRRIEHMDGRSIKNEIHRMLRFRLCRDCRDIFLAKPLNVPLD